VLIFQPLGTPPNSAIHKYNEREEGAQLFVATGATKWNDPRSSRDHGLAAERQTEAKSTRSTS